MRALITSSLVLALPLLSACGGSSSTDTVIQEQKAYFSLGVSDAPVSGATEVWVAFDSVLLRSSTGEDFEFDIADTTSGQSYKMVNLLDYTGDDFYQLFANSEVKPGDYAWIRANIVNGDTADIATKSHIVFDDGSKVPLIVRRKEQSGIAEIQLNQFNLAVGNNQFVLEFDLKKSLVDPQNNDNIVLKPTGVRLVNTIDVATLSGTVTSDLMAACETANAQFAKDDNSFDHAIYLYKGDVETPTDIVYQGEQISASSPFATANVVLDETTQNYAYEIGFLGAGDYKIGYSCLAHLDNIETADTDFALAKTLTISFSSTNNTLNFSE